MKKKARKSVDLIQFLYKLRKFSRKTFGPPERPHAILQHIRKELKEIEQEPGDLEEWVDVVILAFDGAWRTGRSPEEIAASLETKWQEVEARNWPDWRDVEIGTPIEHVRDD